MANEWRSNLWMVIELSVAIMVIWLIADILWLNNKPLLQPMGTDIENVYAITVEAIDSDSPDFVHPADTGSYSHNAYLTDLDILIQRLKAEPSVAFVARHSNGSPYNYNFYGRNMLFSDDSIPYNGNIRTVDPDMPQLLGYISLSGQTPGEMSAALKRGDILISTLPVDRASKQSEEQKSDIEISLVNPTKARDLIGKTMFFKSDSTKLYRIGGVIQTQKRTAFEVLESGTIILPADENSLYGEILVKVKNGGNRDFEEAFRQKMELHRHGNVKLMTLTPMWARADSVHRSSQRANNLLLVVLGFMTVTVFLGLLGTFWFRVQQRVSEVAIRKVCGATSTQIFRRIISEGLLLLIIAAIFSSALMWIFSGKFMELTGTTRTEIFWCEIATLCFMALSIIVSLWWPASIIMNIEPAIAIKDE